MLPFSLKEIAALLLHFSKMSFSGSNFCVQVGEMRLGCAVSEYFNFQNHLFLVAFEPSSINIVYSYSPVAVTLFVLSNWEAGYPEISL